MNVRRTPAPGGLLGAARGFISAILMVVLAFAPMAAAAGPADANRAIGAISGRIATPAAVQAGNVINIFGDSLSTCQDPTSQVCVSWPYELQHLSGIPVPGANSGASYYTAAGIGGIPGQTSTQIAKRQGGVGTTLTFSGNVLNTGSNSVTAVDGATPTNSTGLISSPSNNFTINIPGTVCSQHGTLTRAASGGPPSTTETYTFTPDATLSSFACAAASAFTVDNAALANQPVIIEAGRNNIASPSQVESDIAAMVALVTATGNKNYAVLSILNAEGEGSGTGNYTSIAAINAYLAATYGSHFLDWRSYLVSQYDPTNPVDVLDHTNDIPPYSKRAQNLSGTITSAITTAGQTSFTTSVSLSAGVIIKIGSEYIYVLSTSGTTVTNCTRGYAGTTAATYSSSTAYTGTDALHLSGSTPTVAKSGYKTAATFINSNLGVLQPPSTGILSPLSLQAAFQKPMGLKGATLVAPFNIVANGPGSEGIVIYGSDFAGAPTIYFRTQVGGGSASFGVSPDANNLVFGGNNFVFGTSVWASKFAFTMSGSGLGTSPSTAGGSGSLAGTITVGSSPANATFTLTNASLVSNGYTCQITDETSNASIVIGQTAHSTTTATFQAYSRTTGATAALNAADVLSYQCMAY